MPISDNSLKAFQDRVRRMLLEFSRLKRENDKLGEQLKASKEEAEQLRRRIAEMEKEFSNYKTAKLIEISDDDLEAAKGKVSKLIRDVNKCITILTDQK